MEAVLHEASSEFTKQLAEARAEIQLWYDDACESSNKKTQDICKARQEAAIECYDMVFSTIKESRERIAQHFGLYGLEASK